MDFDNALQEVCKELHLSYALKEEQVETIKNLCDKKHSFCLLPTGFGKSDIFGLLPLVMDKVNIFR